MKVLLMNPPCRSPNMIPLGLGYIASVLRNDGHKVEILDINAYQYNDREVEEKIKEAEFDCVGIGGLTTTYKYIKWLTKLIRRLRPKVRIIVGNMVATATPRLLLENSDVDIAVIDEGEDTVRELFSAKDEGDLNSINGLWYKRNGAIFQTAPRDRIKDLDKIPFPAWDLFPMEVYLKNPIHIEFGLRSINLCAVRGCPYQCVYCSRPFGQRVYARSADNIIEELKELKRSYRVEYVAFSGDHFIVSKKWVLELCNKLRSAKLNIKWGATGRVNLVDKELLKAMKKSGCICLGYGFESGSQGILNNMDKRVTINQAEMAIKLTRVSGIYVMSSFMFGMVGETRDTIHQTVDFIKRTKIPEHRLLFTTPYPATPLYELAKTMKRLPPDEDKYVESLGEMRDTFLVNLTDFSNEELTRLKKEAEEEIQENFDIGIRLGRIYMQLKRRWGWIMLNYKDEGALATLRIIFNKLLEAKNP
ncbi:MAG: radical SAM protein [Candidatus Omnitrophota bacterium]